MARWTARILALFLVATLGAACGDDGGSDTTATTTGGAAAVDTIDSGKLTVCSDMPYAPFEYEEGGETKGVDVDLVTAIAEKIDLEAVFRDTDFDGIFAALAAGSCDMIASSVTINDERKKENNFSDGYYEIRQSLLVRKGDATKYTDFATLKGRTVGVQSETTGADYAKAEGAKAGVEVKEYTGADELFTALKAKQIDGVVQDYPVNQYNATTAGDTVVSKRFDTEPEEYGFVIPKKSTALLEAVNEGLAALRSGGEYDTIIKEYLGDEAVES